MPTVPATHGHVTVPAPGVYVTASVAIVDDGATAAAEVVNGVGVAGLVIKQKRPNIDDGRAAQRNIAVGEGYYLWVRDEIRIKTPAGVTPAHLLPLYVNPANNAVVAVATATTIPLGLITEIPPQRGLPTGFITVNCDLRDLCPAFVAP